MSRFVLSLDEVDEHDAGRVGNKAARLAGLREAGFPVPTGFVLTVGAFRQALSERWADIEARLEAADLHAPQDAQLAAQDIDGLLSSLALPKRLQPALQQAVATLTAGSDSLAVRSSGTIEDGGETSLAGQYETVLGVSKFSEVVDAILRCWRSYFSAHALSARAASGSAGLQDDAGMAVLVQPIIAADCAGVCLSLDPVGQSADYLIVNAAWGMGSGVVDGSVPCDTVWMQRQSLRPERRVIVQKVAQLALGDEGSLYEIPVPREQQRAACLPDNWLARVGQFGLAAEQLFDGPQEVEWAVSNRKLWILQSRPLAGLASHLAQGRQFAVEWDDEAQRHHFWELSYWTKADEAPLLPLEQAYARAIEEMREETCRWMGVERNRARKWVNGRLYAREIAVGLSQADMDVRRAAYEDLKQRWRQEHTTAWDYWGPEIVRATERLRGFDAAGADGPALADHVQEALAVARRHMMLHPMLTFKPPDSYVEAYAAVSGSSMEEAQTEATRLLDGEGTALSDLIDGLYELALLARAYPALAALLAKSPEDVMARLHSLPQADAFRRQLQQFLALYGERTGHGYGSRANLSMPTWREQPRRVLQLAAPYLDTTVEAPAKARARARQRREAEVEALCAACRDEGAVANFREELAYARRAFTVLEEHNHYVDQMALGQVRHAVIEAAAYLAQGGALADAGDVLWLTFDEIDDALRAGKPPSLEKRVQKRRARYARWQQMESPPFIGVPQAHLDERPPWTDDVTDTAARVAGEVKGLGASSGEARGRARVMNAADALPTLAPGDILVAHNVGPRWTPLFPVLGGLVLDSGSVGQHAAATAREYGIPAVIATGDATRLIADGAWVRVDGTAGVVEIEKGIGD